MSIWIEILQFISNGISELKKHETIILVLLSCINISIDMSIWIKILQFISKGISELKDHETIINMKKLRFIQIESFSVNGFVNNDIKIDNCCTYLYFQHT